ncbi:RNA polymerase sigma factor [Marinoscillum sp.]|uniref:RNA polymerase sigma factor n=1 Tax=Marinoscillum sp. TaxID=2024838 RepID=UPI003BA90BAB
MKTNLKMLRINKSNSEENLLRDCRKGKSSAQQSFYERFAPKMLGVCIRYIHDREEAEHVMIGGMVKVFDKLDQYSGEGSLEGWVRRIMVNESLMYIRKNKNMSLEVDVQQAEFEPNYQTLESSLEAADLLSMIAELPVGYRTVFNLYAIEGYNHKEIAETLGINENTSKSQLSRARKLLQANLAALQEKELKEPSHGK